MGAVSFYLESILGLGGTFKELTVAASGVILLIASLQALNSDALINGHSLPSRGLMFVGVILLPLAQLVYLLRTANRLRDSCPRLPFRDLAAGPVLDNIVSVAHRRSNRLFDRHRGH